MFLVAKCRNSDVHYYFMIKLSNFELPYFASANFLLSLQVGARGSVVMINCRLYSRFIDSHAHLRTLQMVCNLQNIYINKVCSTMYPHAVRSLEIRLVKKSQILNFSIVSRYCL